MGAPARRAPGLGLGATSGSATRPRAHAAVGPVLVPHAAGGSLPRPMDVVARGFPGLSSWPPFRRGPSTARLGRRRRLRHPRGSRYRLLLAESGGVGRRSGVQRRLRGNGDDRHGSALRVLRACRAARGWPARDLVSQLISFGGDADGREARYWSSVTAGVPRGFGTYPSPASLRLRERSGTAREGLQSSRRDPLDHGTAEDGAGSIRALNDEPSFEPWVTDEGGPEAIVAMVDDV